MRNLAGFQFVAKLFAADLIVGRGGWKVRILPTQLTTKGFEGWPLAGGIAGVILAEKQKDSAVEGICLIRDGRVDLQQESQRLAALLTGQASGEMFERQPSGPAANFAGKEVRRELPGFRFVEKRKANTRRFVELVIRRHTDLKRDKTCDEV